MRKPLVIFGAAEAAQLAHFYFSQDSDYEVVAFTVDSAYITSLSFCDIPLVPFEEVDKHFSPKGHNFFVALGYSKLNAVRKEKFLAAKALGYQCASYISSRATIFDQRLMGENCLILEDNTVQPFARIYDNVTLWSGNHIGHHSEIKSHSFISSHVVVSGGVTVGEQCFIGVNATLRDHINIGDRCVIGAGALLLTDAEPESVYIGSATERSKVPSTRLRAI
ncbi:acetyltransferase [Synechococcus sp. FGCU-3]|nr:acetyltransferase [Synechococcus sp. FGCU3]